MTMFSRTKCQFANGYVDIKAPIEIYQCIVFYNTHFL